MLGAAVVTAGALVATWFTARWLGRGRPCPMYVASLFDNRIADQFSGTATLIERADIAPGMRVLDAGCGPGRLTIPIARRVGPSGEVVALDIQEGMLERVRRRASQRNLANVKTMHGALEADAPALRTERAAFDRIFLVTVLGEIPDAAGALRSLLSALKADGILSITEMILDPDYQTRAQVRRLAEQAGFVVERSFGSALAFTMNLRIRQPGEKTLLRAQE
jgi:ubiquinone/menaquinone biosynthesis C-methylase UbiE